jgi:dihydroneopterin aldolase
MNNKDCIYIKNFECPAFIGLYDHEKSAPQPIVLHLKLYGKWSAPTFLDYDQVIEKIKLIIAKQHYGLLETLAETLAQALLSSFPIQKLILAIDKPLAVKHALVGVQIERSA